MTDTHDTNLPEKTAELAEEKNAAEVSEQVTENQMEETTEPAEPSTIAETSTEESMTEKQSSVETGYKQLTKADIIARLKEIAAHVENGVLNIELPKYTEQEKAKSKRVIDIH